MNWMQRYKLRNYLQNSVWILPVFSMVIALALVNGFHWIEERAGWHSDFDPDAARTLFATLAGAMFTFIVFVSSTLLVVVQVASSQLTPRILGVVFRNRVTRFSLALFAFTFTLSLAVLLRINTTVPAVTTRMAAYFCMLSLGVFLLLIDSVGNLLRPSGALRAVGRLGHEVIRSVYPRRLSEQQPPPRGAADAPGGEPTATVLNREDGVLLAFNLAGLVTLAQEAGCVVELVPQVGDYVAADSPLFRIHGGKGGVAARAFCQAVALGQERTMEQDPAFAFRIIVDIASKGLSPGINDPTTAVLAIDQIHHLLRSVGGRRLDEGLAYDPSGTLRLVYRTPDWEDFVCLAVTEVRQFGGASIQVARRLRAMLENLIEVLPPERTALLRGELERLRRSAGRFFPEPEDGALADISDLQGVGGRRAGGKPAAGVVASPGAEVIRRALP